MVLTRKTGMATMVQEESILCPSMHHIYYKDQREIKDKRENEVKGIKHNHQTDSAFKILGTLCASMCTYLFIQHSEIW